MGLVKSAEPHVGDTPGGAGPFPLTTFQPCTVEATATGHSEIASKLSIEDASQDVVVPVSIAQGDGSTIATGSFSIKRLDFKIGDGDWKDTSLVANDVQART